jgi:hypothetical protein
MAGHRVNGLGRGASAPRLALSRDEAAEAIGVSRDHFDRHVLPNVKTASIGRRVVVPVRELERYLDERAL